jgi:PPOX class probable F420-dependent enzyme
MEPIHEKLLAAGKFATLATIKRDGRPQLSVINYKYDAGVVRVSVTDDRVKVKNLRRYPLMSLHVVSDDHWHLVVAEGNAVLSPVAEAPDDATVDALVALYRDVAGEHPDWQEFREAMVSDRRILLSMRVERTYGPG